MIEIKASDISGNAIDRIGKQWMLLAYKNNDKTNAMTASWGGMGFLWNKPVVFTFIRPQRYTFDFSENQGSYTINFLPETQRAALNLCGKKSGRDMDKIAAAGLHPIDLGKGIIGFEESELIISCEKKYSQFLEGDCFVSDKDISQWYPEKDFHKMYVGEIKKVWIADKA